jgi:acetyltransferase-like isoleucine patch superfamily enzyme
VTALAHREPLTHAAPGALDPSTLGLRACGHRVAIFPLVRITQPEAISLGDDIIVDDFVFLQGGQGLEIGSHVHIASFSGITGGGWGFIGDFATISSGVRFLTGTDVPDGSGLVNSTIPLDVRAVSRETTRLEAHGFVGANSVVHPGVTIGEGAVIGSQSLVLDDVAPWTINVGTPVRAIRDRPREAILAAAARIRR